MRAKPRPIIPNHHVRSALLWDVMRHRVVIYHRRFGTTYRPHLQSQDIQNIEEGTNEVKRQSSFFLFSFFSKRDTRRKRTFKVKGAVKCHWLTGRSKKIGDEM